MQSRTKEAPLPSSIHPPACGQVSQSAAPHPCDWLEINILSIHWLIVLLVACAGNAFAAEDSPFTCKPDGQQQEMNECAQRDYRAADAALHITYGQVMTRLPVAEQAALRREQRAWLRQRDLQCKAKTRASEGGSIWPLEYFSCLRASTEKRTKELAGL
jgi:uncharacterized protein YecT (DUF1311 family)